MCNRKGSILVSTYYVCIHLCLGFILVLVEIQGFGPQHKPSQLPVFHDAALSFQPACLQSLLLIQRRAGPGDPSQLSKHHALGPRCIDTPTHTHTHVEIKGGDFGINSIRMRGRQREQEMQSYMKTEDTCYFGFFLLCCFAFIL